MSDAASSLDARDAGGQTSARGESRIARRFAELGRGRTFDWRVARPAARKGARVKLFLAGGITPENVAQAIRTAKPYAVDVCSGVEAKPGKKDPKRLEAFMREVEKARKGRR